MKVICINDCDRYLYPDGISTLKDFVTIVNSRMGQFIPMKMLKEENCVEPFFIEEEIKLYYLNPSRIETITEEEVTILPRAEYNKRLHNLMETLCVNCCCYEEDLENDCKEIKEKLCLNGTCWCYEPCGQDDDEFY